MQNTLKKLLTFWRASQDETAKATKTLLLLLSGKKGLSVFLLLAGCSPAPAQDILGSFFPSWMLCAAIGIGFTAALRLALGAAGLDKLVFAPPLAYFAVAVAVTLFAWLYRFGQ